MLGTTRVSMYGLSLDIYDGTVLRYLKGSTEGISEINFDGLLIGA